MGSFLSKVESGKRQCPPRLIIYGAGGIGKSTFAAGSPSPLFVPTEDGTNNLNVSRLPLMQTVEDIFGALEEIATAKHDYKTIVLDSLSGFETIATNEICRKYNAQSMAVAAGGYGKAWSEYAMQAAQLIARLDACHKRGLAIIVIAHADVKTYRDPETEGYDRYIPRFYAGAWPIFHEWADCVLFASAKKRTEKDGKGRTIAAPIGAEGGERIIRTVGNPAFVAKNRYGLPEELPLDWTAFATAYAEAVKQ